MAKTGAPATTLSEIIATADPEPLDDKTWSFWIDTDEARGRRDSHYLVARFKAKHQQPEPMFALLTGHTGCGKSTELARVGHELGNEYWVIPIGVDRRYSLPALDYRQILFFCSEILVGASDVVNAEVSPQEITALRDWFDSVTVEEAKKRGWAVDVDSGGRVGWLSALYARFSGKLSSSGETREKAIKYVEERFDLLIENMEIVVKAIEKKIAPRRILLVVEGLDKIENPEQGRKLFSDHRLELMQLPCSSIFTFPIRLWYDPDPALMTYHARHILPMIPVNAPPGLFGMDDQEGIRKRAIGRQTLREIILKRVAQGLIADDALTLLVEKSGGVLRDLLQLIVRAALEAQVSGASQILLAHAQVAIKSLRNEYANRLSPPAYRDANISIEDIFQTLGKADSWPRRNADQTAAFKMLLQSLCILEYNGDGWHDLHPLVRDQLVIRELEQQAHAQKSS